MILLIATDLDGTLLNNEHKISDYNKKVISAVNEKGIKVILSTGRPTSAAAKFLDDLNIETDMISFNGAMITDRKGDILYENNLESSIGKELIEIAKKYKVYHQGFLGERWNLSDSKSKWLDFYISIAKINNYSVGFDNIKNFSFSKFMFIGENEILKEIAKELDKKLKDKVYYAFSRPVYLEVHSPKVSKANALSFLLNKYDIKKENVMAFGDNNNDIEMLEIAGISVAVDNAENVVKEKSKYITKSNIEDGVGYFINEYFNLGL
ncbi:Cof-type HAD-IIB family hydrolase [Brachyspira catarrhinii]|uniref:Cof-type HAD-IIB family hydrolase n=1 Tax=Brachyspira catarrhinii TaxID=2528966 RepID=UPI001F19D68E|nr:Cof-type HAD-IIB family hydrolase [Brachyspira catarrhinii]